MSTLFTPIKSRDGSLWVDRKRLRHRNEESIRAFFADVHELFIKAMLSRAGQKPSKAFESPRKPSKAFAKLSKHTFRGPFQSPKERIQSPIFEQKAQPRSALKRGSLSGAICCAEAGERSPLAPAGRHLRT